MTIAQEIKEAIRAARVASETNRDDGFDRVLDQVAEGLTEEGVEARFIPAPAGTRTLVLCPAHRPAKAYPMVSVVVARGRAEVLLDPKQVATSPNELADILKDFVTTPELLESLEEVAALAKEPVEAYLRVEPKSVSREDLMLEVDPSQQEIIAKGVGRDVTLRLRVASFRGAGTFRPEVPYKVVESAGFTVTLLDDVGLKQEKSGWLVITGNVSMTDAA